MVAGEGFEPSKAEPGHLQSPPIGRSGNPPGSYKSYSVDVITRFPDPEPATATNMPLP
jgi:hypothetical protein